MVVTRVSFVAGLAPGVNGSSVTCVRRCVNACFLRDRFSWISKGYKLNIQGLQTDLLVLVYFDIPLSCHYLSQWNSVVPEYWHCEKDEVRCDLYSSTIVYILRTWRFVFSLISFLKINYVGESRINWPDILGSIYFCDLFIEQSVLEKNIKITLSHILGYGQRVLNVALFKKETYLSSLWTHISFQLRS